MVADRSPQEASSTAMPLPGSGLDFADPNSPLAPCYLSAAQVVAVGLVIAIFLFFSLLPPLFHTDFWGHLKYGEWIVAHRSLPEREPLSAFSDAEQPFVDFAWLTQVSYCAVFELGGWLAGGDETRRLAAGVDMVRASHGLAVALRFVFLFVALRRRSGSAVLACLGICVVLWSTATYSMIQRPQVMGELCLAALLAAVSAPTLAPWKLIGIPLLMAVWANLHGSFMVGLLLLALLDFGSMLDAVRTTPGWNWRQCLSDARTRQLTIVFLGSSLAACLNPYGPRLYAHVLDLAGHPNVQQMAEWQSIFSSPATGSPWSYLILWALAIASPLAARQRPTLAWALLAAAFGLAPLVQQRHYIWWAMVVPWLVAPQWQWLEEWAVRRWPKFRGIPSFRKTLLAVGMVILAAVWSSPVQLLVGQEPLPLTLTLSRATPYFVESRIADALSPQAPGAEPELIWTSETLADYLLWKLDDSKRLFVYSHVHVFPAAHWNRHTTVLFGGRDWSRILDRHRVSWVLVEPEIRPDLAAALRHHPGWRIVLDEAGDLSKRDPRARLLIAKRHEALR